MAHLLFPLLSSILFVLGAMFSKRATVLGTNAYTSAALSNVLLALVWFAWGATVADKLPLSAWWLAALVAVAFVAGQLFTYLAFQHGDVSIATPIFGVKIVMVAVLCTLGTEQHIDIRIWIAAVLAALGIAVINGGRRPAGVQVTARKVILTVVFALLAALSLSLFDVGLQHCGKTYGAIPFLTTMFPMTGVISLALLPWANRLEHLRKSEVSAPLLVASLLIVIQAISISYALGRYGDATRVNIVYSLRGLWAVLLAWCLSRAGMGAEASHSTEVMVYRLVGALLLLLAVVVAIL